MATSSSDYFVSGSGTNIHYIASDRTGPLVILLHGLGGSTDTFRTLIPSIPPTYRAVAVDIEGFGKTPLNASQTLSFPRYVADLHDLITHLQERPGSSVVAANGEVDTQPQTWLIGHSLGGIISLHYAATYPAQVAGLLVVGVGRSIRGIAAAQQRMRDLATTAREQGMDAAAEIAVKSNFPADRESEPAHTEQVRLAVSSCDVEAYARTAEAVASDEHIDPDYGRIVARCIFVAGDGDMISPVQRSKDISRLVAGVAEVEVVRSGHQMILQDQEGVEQALRKLLSVRSNGDK